MVRMVKSPAGCRSTYSRTSLTERASILSRTSAKRRHAVQVVPVAGDRRRAGDRRFLLHDERTLRPGLATSQFVFRNSLPKSLELADRDVERFLCALGHRPGITQHARFVAEAAQAGVNRIAQPPPLADFGEEAGTHSPAQHTHCRPGRVIVGIAVRNGVVGDADVRLGRVERDVVPRRAARCCFKCGRRLPRPVAEQVADQVDHFIEVDVAGDTEDRLVGTKARSHIDREPIVATALPDR